MQSSERDVWPPGKNSGCSLLSLEFSPGMNRRLGEICMIVLLQ